MVRIMVCHRRSDIIYDRFVVKTPIPKLIKISPTPLKLALGNKYLLSHYLDIRKTYVKKKLYLALTL